MKEYKINCVEATKEGFGKGLLLAAKENPLVFGLGSDITKSVGMNYFSEAHPDRFFSLGIAEQNAVGVAAGLALKGKTPVFSSYGVFAAMRTLDQIRISLCYNNLHVIIGGAHAGISVGPDGATHQALEDIAALRALPNITILSPCDATQTELATRAAINEINGPAYIRFGRAAVPDFSLKDQPFEIGKAQLLQEGTDISIIASGHMVWEALKAAKELKAQAISAEVINIHTIKPLDKEAIVATAKKTGRVISVEEHQVIGGLGSAVCEALAEEHPVPVLRIGINDHFGESGQPKELMNKYGLNAENIVAKCLQMLNR